MRRLLVSFALLLWCCREVRAGNVLLIVLDDVGVDALALYQPGPDLPHTPTLAALAARGILFHNTWANPVCSPTRATILTGRYGFRTGVGDVIPRRPGAQPPLPLAELTLPEVLDRVPGSPVHHAAFGKWHLSNAANGGDLGPNLAGFSHFAGTLFNLQQSYFDWPRVVNGVPGRCVTGGQVPACAAQSYAPTVNVTDALDWMQHQAGRPWVLVLAFNTAHAPFQAPPDALHHVVLPVRAGERCPRDNARPCYQAMIEAMDTEIGRLLAAFSPQTLADTTVLVVADNGTPVAVRAPQPRLRGAKGSLYEGGIRVPLLIAGPAVRAPGRQSHALVNTTDLFATVVELATGQPVETIVPTTLPLDSSSLLPLLRGEASAVRDFAYAERFQAPAGPEDGTAIRTRRFKLLRFAADGREEFYDLRQDPGEAHNLLTRPALTRHQQTQLRQLRTALAELRGAEND